ncbi:MAG TPA: hypothetical protein VHB47_24075 [Thermoanaerobaculia bacterium]|nr:hypothetical protein [Thermoanaerobaculia bacterium]
MDEYERHEDIAAFATAAVAPVGDDFQGAARKAAKLSISDAQVEVFGDLQDLLASLPQESDMVSHDPPITTDAESDRVAEEQRNVQVRAFLYAASRESDNDFHLILGRDPSLSPSMFMTMEISGLPPADADSFAALQTARDAYKTQFGSQLPGFTYHFIDPPMPVEIGGSLFFDITHANGGRPGPKSAKPATIWEVHPVTAITFEPDQG